MAKEKLILDIRYFESENPNIDGSSTPNNVGKIFQLPPSSNAIGVRIARKLREIGYFSGSFDHVYINFTTCLEDGQIEYSPRSTLKEFSWQRYVDFGLNPKNINELGEKEQENTIIDGTLNVLRFISLNNEDKISRIDQVGFLIKEFGKNLKILHKKKETNGYSLSIHYDINEKRLGSTIWIEYLDKKSGKIIINPCLVLSDYEDIFSLVSAISILKGNVVLKPKASYKGSLVNRGYNVPITIPISEIEKCNREKIGK